MARDTRKYELRDSSGNTLYIGITNDLERREAEHVQDGKKFAEMVRILPDDDITIETDRDFILNFSCSSIRSTMTIVGVNGDEYTFLPDPERLEEIAVSMYSFKEMISRTSFSVLDSSR